MPPPIPAPKDVRYPGVLTLEVDGITTSFVGPDDVLVARGLVNYDSAELPGLLGRSTRDLARELGASYEREVVHRDDLVLLPPR